MMYVSFDRTLSTIKQGYWNWLRASRAVTPFPQTGGEGRGCSSAEERLPLPPFAVTSCP